MWKLIQKVKKWFHLRQRIKQEAAYDEFVQMIEKKRMQCMLGEDMDQIKREAHKEVKN